VRLQRSLATRRRQCSRPACSGSDAASTQAFNDTARLDELVDLLKNSNEPQQARVGSRGCGDAAAAVHALPTQA